VYPELVCNFAQLPISSPEQNRLIEDGTANELKIGNADSSSVQFFMVDQAKQFRRCHDRSLGQAQAMLFVGSICERLSLVSLDGEEYAKALGAAAALGIVGGGIYDAMLAHCALKAQAETIYSWNARHYAQCGPEITERLRTP
jgi:hypothetical protein